MRWWKAKVILNVFVGAILFQEQVNKILQLHWTYAVTGGRSDECAKQVSVQRTYLASICKSQKGLNTVLVIAQPFLQSYVSSLLWNLSQLFGKQSCWWHLFSFWSNFTDNWLESWHFRPTHWVGWLVTDTDSWHCECDWLWLTVTQLVSKTKSKPVTE